MAEFFGFGGYSRQPEGYLSPAHLLFVSSLMAMMIFLAVFLGLRYKKRDEKAQSKVLLIAAIAMDSLELFKIVLLCFRNENPLDWLHNLPLFLCSIQLITLPIAALSKGKLKEITLDFLFVFGLLGAVLGTYFAGNNYGAYPVFSFDNVVSGLTHSIAGFGSLYVGITGMAKLKWENFPWCCLTMAVFCLLAYIADVTIPYNYMFLMRGDGTPYDILFHLLGGNPILYPVLVVVLFFAYIGAFYGIYRLVLKLKNQKKAAE